jgi:Ca2+-binding RTX toxin-like protein
MQYTAFDGTQYELQVWRGRHVALLVPERAGVDPAVMDKLLAGFDKGWEWYRDLTGREPTPLDATTVDGRSTIAVVDHTCGAGCGQLGLTGIEILNEYFGAGLRQPGVRGFYDAMAETGGVQQIVYYELGRNFWFYGDQLPGSGFITGYAVINRWYAAEASGFPWDPADAGAPYQAVSLPTLAKDYFDNPAALGSNTLALDHGVDNSTPYHGAPDLGAALYRLLYEGLGADGAQAFWREVANRPAAADGAAAIANFEAAARAASGIDFGFLFKDGWRFATGDAGADALTATAHAGARLALLGFAGDDRLVGSAGAETLVGDVGADRIAGGAGADVVLGGSGDDQLDGGAGGDTLLGGAGADLLTGGSGNDRLEGGAGDDRISGGLGVDTASYALAAGPVRVSLALGATQNTLAGGHDRLHGIENLLGSAWADELTGSRGDNRIDGAAGDDVIVGGGGRDVLTGGDGSDRFTYTSIADSRPDRPDLITDLVQGDVLFLQAIDADPATAGDQFFRRVARFDRHAGEMTLTYDAVHGRTVLDFDVTGDGVADMRLLATGDLREFSGIIS